MYLTKHATTFVKANNHEETRVSLSSQDLTDGILCEHRDLSHSKVCFCNLAL